MSGDGDGLERFLPSSPKACSSSQLCLPDGEFGSALRASLSALYEDRGTAEIVLGVGDGEGVACHAFVLETWSPVLRAQLSRRWTEATEAKGSGGQQIEVPGGARALNSCFAVSAVTPAPVSLS